MKSWCLVLALLPAVLAVKGVDVSQLTKEFGCLHRDGYDFAIVRGFMSTGAVDPNARASIDNAKAAGIPHIDVYLFPCVPCDDAARQADELWSALGGHFGTVWLDIETFHWSSDKSRNQAFISTLASTLKAKGARVGIYTNYYNWESIVGLDWSDMKEHPLWYAHYDDDASFKDFERFGGWDSPAMKQYAGSTDVCGASVDLNYYP